MKLSEWRNEYLITSAEVSKLVRQLAFAGIAIAWVFKANENGVVRMPNQLVWPIIFLCVTLLLDFFHNLVRAEIWKNFCRKNEIKITNECPDPDVTAPLRSTRIISFFYYSKILLLFTSYFLLIRYLVSNLI